MKDTAIPIVFASDNFYAPYMAVAMQSIMENADQDRQYIFYILHQDISSSTEDLLRKQIALFPFFSIIFFNVAEHIGKYDLFVSRHVTVETYFRFLIPELLSEHKKAVYLDGDMICCTDIASLFNIDLENYLLAAVRDSETCNYYTKKGIKFLKTIDHNVLLQLKNPGDYFNAGMIVFNIELLRRTTSTDKLLELAASGKWNYHDQDVLNFLADGKSLLLPFEWNLMFTGLAQYLPEKLKNEYYKAERNPRIIHYKPWSREYYIPYFNLFWKYAGRTPFTDIIVERMESKGLVNHLFNFNHSAIYAAAKRMFHSRIGSGIEALFSFVRRKIFTPIRKRLSK